MAIVKAIKTDKDCKKAKERRSVLNDAKIQSQIKPNQVEELDILEILIQDYEKKFTLGVPIQPRPCPFCKSDNLVMDVHRRRDIGNFVRCDSCYASGPYGQGNEEAIKAWNKRR